MSPHAAQFPEAIQALQFFTGYSGGWTPFERRREGTVKRFWRPATAPGLPEVVRQLDEAYADEIAMGLPQPKRFNGGVGSATVLWCRIEGTDQLQRARAFQPLPTLVLQEGGSSRRLLLWALEAPVAWTDLTRWNKRIAHRLGAPKKWADPDSLWIPLPGTSLRVGRSRPVPVVCGRLTTDTHDPQAIVGRLKDAPDPNAWREAA